MQSHLPIEEYPKAWAEYQRRWLLSWVPSLILMLVVVASASTGIAKPTPFLLLAFAFYFVGYLRFMNWHCPRCDKRFTHADAHRIERSNHCLFCGLERGTHLTEDRRGPFSKSNPLIQKPSKSAIRPTLQRFFYIVVGLAMAVFGLFHRTIQGQPVPAWRTAFIVILGLGYLYIGAMYYFPRNRRKRDELKQLLDEAEAEINVAESKMGHQESPKPNPLAR